MEPIELQMNLRQDIGPANLYMKNVGNNIHLVCLTSKFNRREANGTSYSFNYSKYNFCYLDVLNNTSRSRHYFKGCYRIPLSDELVSIMLNTPMNHGEIPLSPSIGYEGGTLYAHGIPLAYNFTYLDELSSIILPMFRHKPIYINDTIDFLHKEFGSILNIH